MEKLTRRDVLKGALAATGALLLANMPGWKKPAVHVGTVPAFAQTSLGTGDLQVTLTWDTGIVEPDEEVKQTPVDLDLWVVEPDGTEVYYGEPVGPTATLDHDNTYGFGPENTFVAPGMAAAGTYDVYVDYYSGEEFPTTATIRVTTFANTAQQQVKTYTFVFQPSKVEGVYICSINFPAGTIYVDKKSAISFPNGSKK